MFVTLGRTEGTKPSYVQAGKGILGWLPALELETSSPEPNYEVELGRERPFALTVETGTSTFDLDLGSVPHRSHTVRKGAGKFELDFSVTNPHRIEPLGVSSGAAGIELEDFANANFSERRLSGGVDVDYESIQVGQGGSMLTVSASGTAVKL